ncbi:ABC transporter related [Desulfofarcimen acetoxidans DSM 771]|uniref:ABC transporter related n=1 Tax=Desulfofarcimen acetoxidans (strain ATCC 49208 / DSM 771 / KCTC 5769 / VKM B-1644 / 5575) TaxID=485916 RepID=C8VYT3_DESAS|nr:ABC transporter ATP-binding protein [Desulfofarcimen acetoxidans]ACV64804.1 ABC transporter related [Desulfofarcimen acetoxidans DSM 771]
MSSENIVISIKNLSKCYHIYDRPQDRLGQYIIPCLKRLVGRQSKNYFREFWALRDVSFEVKKGETVGIIGRNGSGKSTLLQIICGILTPTSGTVETKGRVAALLELGSGFNPEFTGRENVYMNGAVLGLSREEIDERFEDIAAFAGIGEFIDQLVKTYSSGMYVRLAFAVAINVDPDILIVDEALSVGDELFQRKCFSRIEAIRKNGATILFVSHSGSTIVELCNRAVLMDTGEKLAIGSPKQIVGRYQKLLYAPIDKQGDIRNQIRRMDEQLVISGNIEQVTLTESNLASVGKQSLKEIFDPHLKPSSTIEYESHGAYIESPSIYTLAGERVNNLIRGKVYRYTYTVIFTKGASNVRFGMLIKTTSGVELGGGVSAGSLRDSLPYVEAGFIYRVEFRFRCALNPGVYFLNAGVVGIVNGSETFLHRLIDIAMFRVMPDTENLATGIVDFECFPEIGIQEASDHESRR